MTQPHSSQPHASARTNRTRLEVRVVSEMGNSTLASDVLRGFQGTPKAVPPKHFYDDVGSLLFDRICETPEYYQMRTELCLLQELAPKLIDTVSPTHLVELGSGAARKTRVLLDAVERARQKLVYVPFDVSEGMLRSSAERLLARYPWLEVRGVVGDFEKHLSAVPSGTRRLFVFLGGTIGNLAHDEAVRLLSRIAECMSPSDRLLLGTDLIKDRTVLDRAYNDAAGVTAAFNKNLLSVLNRELGGDFDPEDFSHVAFFHEAAHQIEMHLEARRSLTVHLRALDLTVELKRGERILTEISRKFSRSEVTELLRESGLYLRSWHEPESGYFGLSLAGRVASR